MGVRYPAAAQLWELDPELALRSLLEAADELVAPLPGDRTRDLMTTRLGINGDTLTLAALGETYGVSRERIRQLELNAIQLLVRQARMAPPGGLADQVAALTRRVSSADDTAFIELAVRLSNVGAVPPFIELLRRLLGQPKRVLDGVRQGLAQLKAAEQAARRRGLTEAQQDSWIDEHVVRPARWPSRGGSPDRGNFTRVRLVNEGSLGHAGTFESRKLAHSVQYESMLEFRILSHLEGAPRVVHYQEQPFSIPYQLAGVRRYYVPDILVWFDDGRSVLIEVKPVLQMLDSMTQAKLLAAHRWCTHNGVGLLLTDGRFGSLQLRQRPVEPEAERRLSARLTRGPVRWAEYAGYIEHYGLQGVDLAAMGLRNGWSLRRCPWQLVSAEEA